MIRDIGQNGEDFYALPRTDETKRKILRDNALRLFERNGSDLMTKPRC